jgi:thiosulfate dehydrogenase
MTKHFIRTAAARAAAAFVALAACAEEGAPARPDRDPSTRPISGESVYASRFTDGNTFACATCHALSEPAADRVRRVGHPIGDAAARPSFKNGQFSQLLDAVNTCVTEWMLAPALEEDDPRWQALRTFLTEQAPESAAPIRYQIVEPPADLDGGDASAGMELFNASCSACHGIDAKGTNQAPALYQTDLSRETIARRIRTSGPVDSATYPSLSGGRMPFWGEDRLSDAELLDLVAFVEMLAWISTEGNRPNVGWVPCGWKEGARRPATKVRGRAA